MDQDLFEMMLAGLDEAIAHARGENTQAKLHKVETDTSAALDFATALHCVGAMTDEGFAEVRRIATEPDPIEIISPNPDTSTLEGRISPSRDRTDAMIAPRQPTLTPTTEVHRHPRGGPWPPGGVSWVGGRAR